MAEQLPAWVFREFEPVGVDLNSPENVDAYDRNQGTDAARDDELLDRLGVSAGTVIWDLGTGTGSLPVRAARRGAEAHGVDVSENMLSFAQARAADAGVSIATHHAGFLSFAVEPGTIDAVTTQSALHQLPDAWKQIALNRIAIALRPGGLFYMWDVIWSFDPLDATTQLPAWVDAMAQPEGQGFTRATYETHLREEYSTFSWILEGMIERAGLELVESSYPLPWYGELLARRPL